MTSAWEAPRWRRRILAVVLLLAALVALRTARTLRPPVLAVAPPWHALTGLTVINPARDRRENQVVVMRDGRIESIGDQAPGQLMPRARVFAGRYALPGLIDMDVRRLPESGQVQDMFGSWFLAAGVTTVREVCPLDRDVIDLQRRIDAQEVPWPRLIGCGAGESSGCAPDLLTPDGTSQSAHLAHTPSAWLRAWQSIDPAAIAAQGRLRARSPYTPNLLRWAQLAPDDVLLEQRWLADMLPRFYRDALWPAELHALAGGDQAMTADAIRTALGNMRDGAKRRHDAGAPLRVGSATPSPFVVPGYGMWREMLLLAGAGIPLQDVWAAATRGAGEALGIAQLGVLEPGAPADLLIFGKDPTQDPNAFNSLEAVVAGGRLYPKPLLNGYVIEHARYTQRIAYDWPARLFPRAMMRWAGAGSERCDPPQMNTDEH